MKNLLIISLIICFASCKDKNMPCSKSLDIQGSLIGKYQLVKIVDVATCCNGGQHIETNFDKTYTIVIDRNNITEFENAVKIKKYAYQKDGLTLTTFMPDNIYSTYINIAAREKMDIQAENGLLYFGFHWGKEGEYSKYYFVPVCQ